MATLGRAFVEVRADTDKFPDDVRRAMRRLAQDVRQDTDRAGNLMGQRLATRMRHSLNEQLRRRGFQINIDTELSSASVAATELALRRVTRNREVDVRINRTRFLSSLGAIGRAIGTFAITTIRVLGDFFNFGRQIGQVLGEAFGQITRAAGGAGSAVVSLGAAMANLAAVVVGLLVVLTLMVGILGIILAAASALYQAILLILTVIPGLGVAFLLALGPIALIFTNLGEAIKATAGTTEEFNEAIEGLGDNTGSVLGRLRGLVQFFQDIREETQEAFFEPINEALQNMQTNLGPTFQRGFERVAAAAGGFAASFIELFNHPNTERFFDNLFGLAELGFDEIGESVVNLVGSFANLINETFPELEDTVQGIADVIQGWADGINEFANDPALDEKLETWKESFNTVVELIGTAVELVQTLFNGFQEDGIVVLEEVNELMESFIEYLESERGQAFFDGLRVAALLFLVILGTVTLTFILWIELLGHIEQLFKGNLTNAVEGFNANPLGSLFGGMIGILGVVFRIEDGFERWGFVLSLVNTPLAIARALSGGIRNLVDNIVGAAQRTYQRILSWVDGLRRVLGGIGSVRASIQSVLGIFSGIFGIVSSIANIVSNISFPSPPSWLHLLPGLAEGGIITRPMMAMVGEAGPEVVIPLTDRNRAMELARESGLLNLIKGGDGAAAGSIALAPEVRVFIGNQELRGLVRVEISNSNRQIKTRQMARTGSNP